MSWAPQSLHVTIVNVTGFMQLDIDTVRALELVDNVNSSRGLVDDPAATASSASGPSASSRGGSGGAGGSRQLGRNGGYSEMSAAPASAPPSHLQIALRVTNPGQGSAGGATRTGRGAGLKGSWTMFDVLNHTKTRGGARLLRASILQPLNSIPTIKLRYAIFFGFFCEV